MSLVIDNHQTNYTTSFKKIIVSNNQKKRALFLEDYKLNEFTNPKQLNYVIDDIVFKGYLMDTQNNDQIIFKHPHNTFEKETIYNFWPKTQEVEKITRTFLNYI